jgi:hypothetical protein
MSGLADRVDRIADRYEAAIRRAQRHDLADSDPFLFFILCTSTMLLGGWGFFELLMWFERLAG